jgi:exopolysaccharide biosynthesis polyprenyl glycosylphosphotransferase
MTRMIAHRVVPELAALWLGELTALFLVLHVLQATGVFGAAVRQAGVAEIMNRAAIMASIMGFTSLSVGLYRADMCLDGRRLVMASLFAAISGGLLLFLLAPVLPAGPLLTPMHVLAPPLLWLTFLLLSRATLGTMLRHRLFGRRVMVVGKGPRAANLSAAIQGHRDGVFDVIDGGPDAASALVAANLRAQRIWAVVVAEDSPARLTVRATQACQRAGIRAYDDGDFWEQQLGRIDLNHADPNWFTLPPASLASSIEAVIRRLAELAISIGLLAFTLPVMALTAIAIRLDSKGPVFYRQTRVGLNGQPFTLLKFRSMRVDAEVGGKPRWASQNDPRVTRVGAFIRLSRIDELPQLINVLKGEMSFIGPRPERPEFVNELTAAIPLYPRRACVKPGITGWAQVSYPYGASVEDARQKLSYDLYYIKYRSLLLDLLILIATIRVILFREGSR